MSKNAGDNFSVEEDEILINFVSQNPIIFDISNEGYKNSYKREKAWGEIAKMINKTSKACKNRWRNIKDTYYRQKKKNKSGTGSAAHPRSKFQSYRSQLSFLDLVSQERTSISTVDDEHSHSSSDMLSPGPSHRDDLEATTEPTDMTDPENSLTPPENHLLDSTDSTKINKRIRKNKDNILIYLKKRDESRQKLLQNFASLSSRNNCDSDDEIDLFSRQANSILKKLPSYLQIKAMQELFETLTKYKMLAVDSHSGIMYSPSPLSSTSEPRPGSTESTYHMTNPTAAATNYNPPTTSESLPPALHNNIYSPINAASTSQEEPADLSSINMQCPPISAASSGQEEPADLSAISSMPCPPITAASTSQEEPADLSLIGMEYLLFNNEN